MPVSGPDCCARAGGGGVCVSANPLHPPGSHLVRLPSVKVRPQRAPLEQAGLGSFCLYVYQYTVHSFVI